MRGLRATSAARCAATRRTGARWANSFTRPLNSSLLVRQEMALAKAELTQKGRRMGRGGGLLGAAGAIGYVGLIALAGTGVAALSLVLPVWAAALVVTGLLFAIAGVLALAGRGQLRHAAPPRPEVTLGSVKADVEEIKERAHHR